jgi:hypothetical protein
MTPKQIFVYYVKASGNTSFSPVYNKKKILIEKDCKSNFYANCMKQLESIKNQIPRTFKNSYFIFFPGDSSYLHEIIKFHSSEEYVLINIQKIPEYKYLKENFRSFIKEINGEEIFEDIDLLIDDSFGFENANDNEENSVFTIYRCENFRK